MSDILYRPSLDYEKDYHTEGSFQDSMSDQAQDRPASSNVDLDEIREKLLRTKVIFPSLPKEVVKSLANVIKGAEYIYNQIDPEYYDPNYVNSNTSIIIAPSSNTNTTSYPDISDTSDDDGPDGVFSDLIPLIDVKVNKKDPISAIESEYTNTLASILLDYLNNLQVRMNKYFSKISVSATEAGINNFKFVGTAYDIKTTNIKNQNLYHVSDTVIRTQIVMNQKLRLFKKLYNTNETISHVRACKVAKDLRIRYYKEKNIPNNQYLDLTNNMMLSDAKQIYDKKYKENLCNLYKYLNSSVIIIDECLSMFVQEAQAKMILMKEEGIKL